MGVKCAVPGEYRVCGAGGHSSYAPRSGGWVRALEGGRAESTTLVMGQVLSGGETSSGRSKHAFVFDFLFAFGRLVGDTGLVFEIGRPDL
jgi:hypothetical protein